MGPPCGALVLIPDLKYILIATLPAWSLYHAWLSAWHKTDTTLAMNGAKKQVPDVMESTAPAKGMPANASRRLGYSPISDFTARGAYHQVWAANGRFWPGSRLSSRRCKANT